MSCAKTGWREKGRDFVVLVAVVKVVGCVSLSPGSHISLPFGSLRLPTLAPYGFFFQLLGAAATAVALGFGELQSVKETNNVLGPTLLLPSLICLTQGKL